MRKISPCVVGFRLLAVLFTIYATRRVIEVPTGRLTNVHLTIEPTVRTTDSSPNFGVTSCSVYFIVYLGSRNGC